MKKINGLSVVGAIATVLGVVGSLLSNYVQKKTMDMTIKTEVAKAVEQIINK
jgi:hypothetical protein